jgi:hypothetical protein
MILIMKIVILFHPVHQNLLILPLLLLRHRRHLRQQLMLHQRMLFLHHQHFLVRPFLILQLNHYLCRRRRFHH